MILAMSLRTLCSNSAQCICDPCLLWAGSPIDVCMISASSSCFEPEILSDLVGKPCFPLQMAGQRPEMFLCAVDSISLYHMPRICDVPCRQLCPLAALHTLGLLLLANLTGAGVAVGTTVDSHPCIICTCVFCSNQVCKPVQLHQADMSTMHRYG